jgi:hypothetical protein
MHDAAENTISPAIASLLELFRTDLEEVRFPDVDLPSLEASADEVRSASSEVSRAEQALTAALKGLSERQEALHHKSLRALAYARIYAEDDAELLSRLEAVQLARPARGTAVEATTAKRRGRPRKQAGSDTERLFQVEETLDSGEAVGLS